MSAVSGPRRTVGQYSSFGHRVDVAEVGPLVAEERLPADDVDRHPPADGRLAALLDLAAVVARLVGHQHEQEPAVLADQRRVVPDHFLDRPHRVLDPGIVDPEVIDGAADLVDVEGRLLQLVVQALAEPDDRVVQRIGRLLVLAGAGPGVDLQLRRDAVELLLDGPLVVLHAARLVEEPDDGQLVLGEVPEDLAGELVERDADVARLVGDVAGELAAPPQVDRGHGGQLRQARDVGDHLDRRQARLLADGAGDAHPGRGRGGPGPDPAAEARALRSRWGRRRSGREGRRTGGRR